MPQEDEFEEPEKCTWCEETYESDQLHDTEIGRLCDRCIDAILSRGEHIWVKR